MVGRVFTLFLGHDNRASLSTHDDFVFGFFEVGHFDQARRTTGCKKRSFVDQVSEIGA